MSSRRQPVGGARRDPRVERGRAAEDLAVHHLERIGIRILARNLRAARYEIDLVGQEGETLVFVEVRSRTTSRFGSPLHSIGPEKQRRVARAARALLARSGASGRPVRFDVVGVTWVGSRAVCEHVRAAFEVRS